MQTWSVKYLYVRFRQQFYWFQSKNGEDFDDVDYSPREATHGNRGATCGNRAATYHVPMTPASSLEKFTETFSVGKMKHQTGLVTTLNIEMRGRSCLVRALAVLHPCHIVLKFWFMCSVTLYCYWCFFLTTHHHPFFLFAVTMPVVWNCCMSALAVKAKFFQSPNEF